MNTYRIAGRFNRPFEVWVTEGQYERKVCECPTRRFAEIVINGFTWMEGEASDVDWNTEAGKP